MLCVCADFPSWQHEPHRPKALSERTHTVEQSQLPPTKLCENELTFILLYSLFTSGPKDVLKVPCVSGHEHHQLPGIALRCRHMWFPSPSASAEGLLLAQHEI